MKITASQFKARCLRLLDEVGRTAAGEDLESRQAGDFLTAAPPVLRPDQPWSEAVAALREHEAVLVELEDGYTTFDRQDLMQGLKRLAH